MQYEFKQERVANHSVAKKLNELAAEGWEYVEIIERIPAPQYRNGGAAGPGQTIFMVRKPNDDTHGEARIALHMTLQGGSMPIKPMQHTKPCSECPFRRKSMPGYLGSNDPENFSLLAMSDVRMPCHTKVDYEDDDWEILQETAPQCAGRAIFLRNTAKRPQDPSILVLDADRANVFSNITEFNAHHEIRPYREILMERAGAI